ncbi:MAG: TIGR04283 family arsenosugar biosynthesis glycosyltransferase [Candidatus Omnitrophica bacterium]|nr:TIGR04283 family arsenosugar biosynthesis glycosyltransferase [Candidatus Omnitrophota bacterium]
MELSIILPTLNEVGNLRRLLPDLTRRQDEVILVDAGSTDETAVVAKAFPVKFFTSAPGRGAQMNVGAFHAQGEILWFLHADSQPPGDWRDQLLRGMSDSEVVGGGFTVRIDAPGFRYRLLDRWGRFRNNLEGTFYGDQGIFVRKGIFEAIGGFPDWTSLEDLDFSSRMRRRGRVVILPGPLKTSARRWEGEGFWQTVFQQSGRVLSYQKNPARPRPGIALVVMAKAPLPGQVKTRLVPPLTAEEAAALAKQLLVETVETVTGLPAVRRLVAVAPPEGVGEVRRMVPAHVELLEQSDGDLGRRLDQVFQKLFLGGAKGVIVIGADHPKLPGEFLRQAIQFLERGDDPLVLGPAEDGGYYLVGLNRPHPELFQGIPWSTPSVLEATLAAARAAGLSFRLLPSWYDIDRPEDLARL